ncbi:hypothetical protein [Oceanospirillum maris]|jgi:hypothetical protein|uniref:hypothetical protein n=1 Tax=Oceanospirillum maris TaxID=64977 RepID=UPI000409297E|nr:hypothetical protein [Oceanospirillum maris]
MQNMRKLKEDALRKKQEFEEKKRNEEFRKQRKMAGGHTRANQSRNGTKGRKSQAGKGKAGAQVQPQMRKKPKRTPARWIIDTLLVLGALMVLVVLFNPY